MKLKYFMPFVFAMAVSVSTQGQQKPLDVEKQIDEILVKLTLEEKVAMCHAQSKFSSPGVPRLGIPELWMSDGPHGVRAEIKWDDWGHAGWTNDSITAFPALTALAATFNPEVSLKYGKAIGAEARYRRKDVLLGPGVNIYRTPVNGRNFEYMGEDPFLASVMVVPYIHGVQENGVAACVKHYALNNQEKWRGHIDVIVGDRALHEIYLPAFRAAVQQGKVWSVMGAYNKFRGQFCCHNDLLINKILKRDWGFDGVVITDWGGAHNTREAALNGLDLEMGSWTNGLTSSTANAYDSYYLAQPFLKLIKNGEIPESVLDDKVRRILRLMLRTTLDRNRPFGRQNAPEHSEVAYEVAKESVVLLKNQEGFFPLDANREMTIAVVGDNATRSMTVGGGSSELKGRYEISPLDEIKSRFPKAKVLYARGYAAGPSAYGRVIPSKLDADILKAEALETARKADVVLFVGGLNKNHQQDCEDGDRQEYELPFGQVELIEELVKANPNTGVVLVGGNAVGMSWLPKVKAVVYAWYLGSESGNALGDVLCGAVNPSGKLPFSFPAKLSDNAAHFSGKAIHYPGDSTTVRYDEGILVGYRWHDTKKIKPLFAFGHGLSYTSFEIGKLNTNKKTYKAGETITVSGTLTNTGSRDGAEVVQLYVGKPKSKVERAVKELKGFQKIYLEKGGNAQISICLEVDKLAYYDESVGGWVLEKGDYVIYAGNASDQITQTVKVSIL